MMTDPQPPLLAEDTDEALVLKLAEAYNQAETSESEAWVRAIAARTIILLTAHAGEGEPGGVQCQDDIGNSRE